MKLEIQEVHLLQQSLGAATIKGSDAIAVASTMAKLDKEFSRLEAVLEKA
jgi:hypothetical protein